MQLRLDRVRENVRQASTEDLLDRVTVYREEMEPEALDVIEDELRSRGVSDEEVQGHRRRRDEQGVLLHGGMPARCSRCDRPAVARRWGWHRLLGLVPVLPRPYYYCAEHLPAGGPRGSAS